jgi:hypothetical protein
MMYTKPQLLGYVAISAIQLTGPNAKTMQRLESDHIQQTQPAYEADE